MPDYLNLSQMNAFQADRTHKFPGANEHIWWESVLLDNETYVQNYPHLPSCPVLALAVT